MSAIGVILLFEGGQRLSIRAGEIPPRGIHIWKGRLFLHWDHFPVQRYGDTIFLSALNAFALPYLSFANASFVTLIYAACLIVLAIVAYVIWLHMVSKAFREGVFTRWDWGFATKDGETTFAGKVHGAYWCFEASIAALTIGYGLWTDMPITAKIGSVASCIGYGIMVYVDARIIGTGGGPFENKV